MTHAETIGEDAQEPILNALEQVREKLIRLHDGIMASKKSIGVSAELDMFARATINELEAEQVKYKRRMAILHSELQAMSNRNKIDVQEVKERMNIVDVIGETVQLKKSGNRWVGKCPFHNEKTPSFTVYEASYYCYGCRESGDVFTFIMKTKNLDFKQALELCSQMTR